MPTIRDMDDDDSAFVLALNQELEWATAPMDSDRLGLLRREGERLVVVEDDEDGPVGFAISLRPGGRYDSVNYRWFCDNFDDFLYLDRILVSDRARRRGIATLVYDAMEDHARRFGRMVCEVYSDPPNLPSLAFHAGRGYLERGHQRMADGHEVVLLEKPL
jgi:predicted GNAT superfamily acetyltransferase